MRESKNSDTVTERTVVKGGPSVHPEYCGDRNIEPGRPFPEPEVKPAVVSQPPDVGQVAASGTDDQTPADSLSGTLTS